MGLGDEWEEEDVQGIDVRALAREADAGAEFRLLRRRVSG
jgi:hypothetical protein